MSDGPNKLPPEVWPRSELPAQDTKPQRIWHLWIGFAIGIAAGVWFLAFAGQRSRLSVATRDLIFAVITKLPVVAIVFAIIPRTRKFGLGLLLGCGISFLAVVGYCFATFKI